MKRFFEDNRQLFILAGLALVIRVVFAVPAFVDLSRTGACSDSVAYENIADNLLHGNGFSQESVAPYHPSSKITPGYPFFLAGVYGVSGQSRLAVILIQILLTLIPVVVLYRYVRKRFGDRAALWSTIILTLDVNLGLYVNQVMTETLFIAFFIPGLVLILRSMDETSWIKTTGAGLLLGVSTLIRPIVLYFGVIVLIWLLLSKITWGRLARWGVIVAIQLICICPWVVRNRVVFGEFFYTTISDVNLWRLHAAGIKASVDGLSREEAQVELEREAIMDYEIRKGSKPGNEASYYLALGRHARGYLLKHPLRYTGSLILGGFATLLDPLSRGEASIYLTGKHPDLGPSRGVFVELLKGRVFSGLKTAWHDRLRPFGTVVLLLFIIYGVFHIAKLVFGLRAYVMKGLRDPMMLLFLLTGIYFLGLVGIGITPRLRVPAEPLLAVLAGIGLVARRQRRDKIEKSTSGDKH